VSPVELSGLLEEDAVLKRCGLFGFTLAGVLATSAQASDPAPVTPAPDRNAVDRNELVCEKLEIIGSRLQKKRVCMTRSQWADQRSQDRQEIQRVQVQRGMKGE
jgi:hypothetical protein